jgi:hypothetical protein
MGSKKRINTPPWEGSPTRMTQPPSTLHGYIQSPLIEKCRTPVVVEQKCTCPSRSSSFTPNCSMDDSGWLRLYPFAHEGPNALALSFIVSTYSVGCSSDNLSIYAQHPEGSSPSSPICHRIPAIKPREALSSTNSLPLLKDIFLGALGANSHASSASSAYDVSAKEQTESSSANTSEP